MCQEEIQKLQQALHLQLEARAEEIHQTQKQKELRCTVEMEKKTCSTTQEGVAEGAAGGTIQRTTDTASSISLDETSKNNDNC